MKFFNIVGSLLIIGMIITITYSCNKENSPDSKSVTTNIQTLSLDEIVQKIVKQYDQNAVITPKDENWADLPPPDPGNVSPFTTSCFYQPTVNETCTSNHISTTWYLPPSPPRPGCSDMQVEFDMLVCIDNITGILHISYSNFEAFYGNCPAFDIWYQSLLPQDKADAQDKWEFDISMIIELYYAQGVVMYFDTNCPEIFLVSDFTVDLCYNRCLVPSDGFPGFRSVKNFCGSQCCVRTRDACKGIGGAVHFYVPTYTTKGLPCTNTRTVCPFNSIPLSKVCGVTCGPK